MSVQNLAGLTENTDINKTKPIMHHCNEDIVTSWLVLSHQSFEEWLLYEKTQNDLKSYSF